MWTHSKCCFCLDWVLKLQWFFRRVRTRPSRSRSSLKLDTREFSSRSSSASTPRFGWQVFDRSGAPSWRLRFNFQLNVLCCTTCTNLTSELCMGYLYVYICVDTHSDWPDLHLLPPKTLHFTAEEWRVQSSSASSPGRKLFPYEISINPSVRLTNLHEDDCFRNWSQFGFSMSSGYRNEVSRWNSRDTNVDTNIGRRF